MLSARDAFFNLRYCIGLAIEVAIIHWLLAGTNSYTSPGACLSYVLLITSTGMLLYGLFWYWTWFAQRGASGWYFVALGIFVCLGFAEAGYLVGNKDRALLALFYTPFPVAVYEHCV